MAEATDVAIAAGVIVTGTTLIRNAHEGKAKAAPIIFGFMMTSMLLLIALGSPKFAKGLSYFAMVGAFTVNGPTLFALAGGLGPTAKAKAKVTGVNNRGAAPTATGA